MPFGNFESTADAAKVKSAMKKRSPKITFSALIHSRNGYAFKGKLVYIKSIAAPASAVKQAIVQSTPGSKVTVTKV